MYKQKIKKELKNESSYIYVIDDDSKIVYNVNGKEETIKLEELESSTLFSNGAPV